jgi:hypothetical protein
MNGVQTIYKISFLCMKIVQGKPSIKIMFHVLVMSMHMS